jgi:uncharacterized protein with von Willebrand factor type A (vWA) domain
MSFPLAEPSGKEFLASLIGFGHLLRSAGLPVTLSQLANVARGLQWIDLGNREQVFFVCRALLVTRHEDLALFEFCFNRFWSAPDAKPASRPQPMPLAPRHDPPRQGRFTIVNFMAFKARHDARDVDVGDRTGRWSDEEILRSRRFAEMTPEELDAVRRLLQRLEWGIAFRISRRQRRDPTGTTIDFRRVLRQASRLGALPARLPRRRRIEKERPLVLLADISGSMEKYSRLVLQLFHSAVRSLQQVETFVFATRLSRITPALRLRNIDRAIDQAAREVADWSGGTRIGASLGAFNRNWSRRVLRRGAVVVIVSDGCDLGDPAQLRRELRYLQHRCYRLIWLNPHLGHPDYEPRVAGMAAALDYIDDFQPIDDLQSLEHLARALAALPGTSRRLRRVAAGWRPARSARRFPMAVPGEGRT